MLGQDKGGGGLWPWHHSVKTSYRRSKTQLGRENRIMQVANPKQVQGKETAITLFGEQNSKAFQTSTHACKGSHAEWPIKIRLNIGKKISRLLVGLEPRPDRQLSNGLRPHQLCHCCTDTRCILQISHYHKEETSTKAQQSRGTFQFREISYFLKVLFLYPN